MIMLSVVSTKSKHLVTRVQGARHRVSPKWRTRVICGHLHILITHRDQPQIASLNYVEQWESDEIDYRGPLK